MSKRLTTKQAGEAPPKVTKRLRGKQPASEGAGAASPEEAAPEAAIAPSKYDELLRKIYYDVEEGVGSIDKVYKEAKKKDPNKDIKDRIASYKRFEQEALELDKTTRELKRLNDIIKRGNIPKEYITSVEKGFRDSMKNGPLAGFEVDAMKVTLKDGSFHPVDSDSLSFELAAKIGFKESARVARAVIMEPIMKLEVITPEENMGDIVGDLNRRRGQVNNMDDRAGAKVVKAIVPLSEMFGYVTSLRTLSSGRATSTMEFSHYAQTPSNISEDVIASIKGNNQE